MPAERKGNKSWGKIRRKMLERMGEWKWGGKAIKEGGNREEER
jgi:hypothetical protein